MISFNLKNKKDAKAKREPHQDNAQVQGARGSLFEVEKEQSTTKKVTEFAAGELPEVERLKLEEETRRRKEFAKTKKIIHIESKNWRQDLVDRREEEDETNGAKEEDHKTQFGLSVYSSGSGERRQEARELQALRQDIDSMPDMASVEDYEAMPVEDFGAALFRGMESALPRKPVTEAAKVPERRPALLGLGAKSLEEHLPEELGAWGKASRPKPEYTPVVLRNVRTGEIVDKDKVEDAERASSREPSGEVREGRDGSRDRSRDDRGSRRRSERPRDGEYDSRRDRHRERSPRRDTGRDRDRDRDSRRHRDRRDDRDRKSRREDDRDRYRRDDDRDRRDRRDRHDRDRRDRDRR